ncbi:hypothetical protein [Caproicibacter fermentans]|uniref:Uncharacterized protein n=1 Tax=Caproicibacter fermentans TaxID=2576756 RepID=A0A7G8T9Y9_9FIRM|nr:hypothetical protein [Caproicibacter fermentans]QNK40430.1 hypothetical protein HCR03_17560 [Caproicibacter fermentans]
MNIYYSSLNQIGIPVQESLKNIIQSGGTAVELLLDGAEWNEFNLRTREFGACFPACRFSIPFIPQSGT